MAKPKVTYCLDVWRYTGEHGSTQVSETLFTTKAQGKRAFLAEVPAHLPCPDMVVTLVKSRAGDNTGVILAAKYRRENTANLHPGWFA